MVGLGFMVAIGVYVILGFMLAWFVGMVAHEEISVGRGVAVVVLSGIGQTAVGSLIHETAGPWIALLAAFPVLILIMAALLRAMARIAWKPSFGVAACYALLIGVINALILAARLSV